MAWAFGDPSWKSTPGLAWHAREEYLTVLRSARVCEGLMHLEQRWDVGESEHVSLPQRTVATAASASCLPRQHDAKHGRLGFMHFYME